MSKLRRRLLRLERLLESTPEANTTMVPRPSVDLKVMPRLRHEENPQKLCLHIADGRTLVLVNSDTTREVKQVKDVI